MSDPFESLLERWLRERGRPDRDALAALAGHVAVLPPRHARPRRPLLAAATIVVVLIAIVASLPRTGQTGVGADASPSVAAATPSPVPTASPTPAPARTQPAWAQNAEGALDCDGPVQPIGGEIGEIDSRFTLGTASPYPWLEYVKDVELPITGWTEEPKVAWEFGDSNYVRFVNEVDGKVKAVIILQGHSTQGASGAWRVAAFRACQAAEFDPHRGTTLGDAPWVDASGSVTNRVRTLIGPVHCGWESMIWLQFDGRLYLRDPLGLFADVEAVPYLSDVELPPSAVSTGFTSVGRELFTMADPDFVWVRIGETVERWPRAPSDIGCA